MLYSYTLDYISILRKITEVVGLTLETELFHVLLLKNVKNL